MAPGKFVVFDGVDFAGKGTLLKAFCHALPSRADIPGFKVTREPGGTPLGEQIRDILKAPVTPTQEALDPLTQLFLFQAARRHHCHHIRELLAQGLWVICDRFTASTRAYQGAGFGLHPMAIDFTTDLATDGLRPDLTVLVDISPEAAEVRRVARAQDLWRESTAMGSTGEMPADFGKDPFESQDAAFHARVRLDYLRQAALHADRWLVTDTTKWAVSDVVKYILEHPRLVTT